MKKISAVLVTHNEENKIENALRSLEELADEIVVVDSFSTDGTAEICRRYSSRLVQRSWEGYRRQKQFATQLAQHDWVFSLDADETASEELGNELMEWKQTEENGTKGYYLPRKAFFMGRWIEHTTWYPDWQLRLFCKSSGAWQGGRVHESFRVAGPTARFRGHIYHHTYCSLSEYLSQLETFSTLAAKDYYESGKRSNPLQLLIYPPAAFFKNYVVRLGFLDGLPGLAVSTLAAVSTLMKYLKLWEIEHSLHRHG